MTRFLTLAFPLLVVLFALFNLGVELLGLAPQPGPLVGWREGGGGLPGGYVVGSWVLEALGLTALYLLVAHPGRPRWLSGLLTGWIAWVFRGPLLVLAAVGMASQPGGPWWRLSLRWLLLYTLAGLLLAVVARRTHPEEEVDEEAAEAPPSRAVPTFPEAEEHPNGPPLPRDPAVPPQARPEVPASPDPREPHDRQSREHPEDPKSREER